MNGGDGNISTWQRWDDRRLRRRSDARHDACTHSRRTRIDEEPLTDRAEKIGGSAAHDQRREGAVTPREHNLKRRTGNKSPTEQRLEDPDRPHGEPSSRERRRAKERAEG